MPRYAPNKVPPEVKRRDFERIRQGLSGSAPNARRRSPLRSPPMNPFPGFVSTAETNKLPAETAGAGSPGAQWPPDSIGHSFKPFSWEPSLWSLAAVSGPSRTRWREFLRVSTMVASTARAAKPTDHMMGPTDPVTCVHIIARPEQILEQPDFRFRRRIHGDRTMVHH
jgi:hypothetical protein